MEKQIVYKYLPFILLPLGVITVAPHSSLPLGNTFIWWVFEIGILYILFHSRRIFFDPANGINTVFLSLYLYWVLFTFFRGFYMAETYWDWKALITYSMALLLANLVFVATDVRIVRLVLNKYIKFGLPLFFLFAPFMREAIYGEYLAPVSLLLFFLPLLKVRHRFILIGFALLVIFSDFGARSNVIKFSLPILMSVIYYLRFFLKSWILEPFRIALMLAPIVIFILAVNGIFNPFSMDEYVEGDYNEVHVTSDGKVKEESLTADTRTFLYVEVIQSALNNNYWLLGRTMARGNDTEYFGDWAETIYGRRERPSNESSLLNVFTWMGIIGVVLYFFLFWHASFISLHRSNNSFSQILGLFIAFRWMYAWVEDFTSFNIINGTLWIIVGLGLSKSFRSMTNTEVKLWIRGVFIFPKKINKGRI